MSMWLFCVVDNDGFGVFGEIWWWCRG